MLSYVLKRSADSSRIQSWRVRLQALPLIQGMLGTYFRRGIESLTPWPAKKVFYFRQVPLLSDAQITEIMEVCICIARLRNFVMTDDWLSSVVGVVQVFG